MSEGTERMQDVCLAELVGAAVAPDVRAAVRVRLGRRRSRAWMVAGVVGAVAAALLVIFSWPDRSAIRDPALQRFVAVLLESESGARQWAAYAGVLDEAERRPQLWTELETGLPPLFDTTLGTGARSRLVAVLSHAPGGAVDFSLIRQVVGHREDLDAEALVLLATRGIDGAAEALRELPPREGRGRTLHAIWLGANGAPGVIATLRLLLEDSSGLATSPHYYFAAAVTLYRAKQYDSWDICWRTANRHIRRVQRDGDEQRAFELTVMMYWFYGFLNIVEPLPLDDLRRRAGQSVKSYQATQDKSGEIDALLLKMR